MAQHSLGYLAVLVAKLGQVLFDPSLSVSPFIINVDTAEIFNLF